MYFPVLSADVLDEIPLSMLAAQLNESEDAIKTESKTCLSVSLGHCYYLVNQIEL